MRQAVLAILFFTCSVAAGVNKRDFAAVTADFQKLNQDIKKADSDVLALPLQPTTAQILQVHTDLVQIDTDINQTRSDITPLPTVTSSQAQQVITDVKTVLGNIITLFTDICNKKMQLYRSAVAPALVRQDINAICRDLKSFENVVVAHTPSSLLATAKKLTSSLDAACSTLIACLAGTAI